MAKPSFTAPVYNYPAPKRRVVPSRYYSGTVKNPVEMYLRYYKLGLGLRALNQVGTFAERATRSWLISEADRKAEFWYGRVRPADMPELLRAVAAARKGN